MLAAWREVRDLDEVGPGVEREPTGIAPSRLSSDVTGAARASAPPCEGNPAASALAEAAVAEPFFGPCATVAAVGDTEQVVDWRAKGYFRFPFGNVFPNVDTGYLEDWQEFERHLQASKAGHFSDPKILWSKMRSTRSWQVSGAYGYLIGRTAPASFLRELGASPLAICDIDTAVTTAHILGISGLLFAVLPILQRVEILLDSGEVHGPLRHLADMLFDGTKSLAQISAESLAQGDRFTRYAKQVATEVAGLAHRLGTDQIQIWRGEVFSLRKLVEQMSNSAQRSHLDPRLRELFEATTGIDCSEFFQSRVPQPSIIQASLKSLNAGMLDQFTPGHRYFFGHRIGP